MSKKVKKEQFVLCAHYNAQAFVKQSMQIDVFNTVAVGKKVSIVFDSYRVYVPCNKELRSSDPMFKRIKAAMNLYLIRFCNESIDDHDYFNGLQYDRSEKCYYIDYEILNY